MANNRPASHSPWALKIGSVAGIPIRIHFTFFLFFAWILASAGQNPTLVWLLPAVFGCVLLHELGHALTAKKFGVETRDITLYPIGGVAMLQGKKPAPKEEFWITLAGPMVNVVISAILFPFVLAQLGKVPIQAIGARGQGFVEELFVANLILAVFNLIPAFPMDGGRILRAILAMKLPEVRATQIAATIGQFIAIVFGFVGVLSGNVVLMLIALFVYIGASQELAATVSHSTMEGHKVADAMQTRFRTIESGASLDTAAKMLLEGSQQDFPVVVGEQIVGVLTRNDIARGLAIEGPTAYVSGHMRRDLVSLRPEEPLEDAFEALSQGTSVPLFVMDGDSLVGMLTSENMSEFIMLANARARAALSVRR